MVKKPTPGTAVVDWDKEMEKQAQIAADAQRATEGGGGKFFSTRGGILKFGDQTMPDNRIAAVIIADISENSYYDRPFEEGNSASPVCFAFAHDEGDLEPHPAVDANDYFERQSDVCASCPQNQFGSAAVGKGKACKNGMRIAVILAGTYTVSGKGRAAKVDFDGPFDDPDHYADAEVAYIKLPYFSTKEYAKWVRETAEELKRPPHGVFVEMWLEPDAKAQFKWQFAVIDKIPNDLLPTIMARHAKEKEAINFPYSPPREDEEAAQPETSSAANKLRGKGAPAKKAAGARR